MGTLARFWRHLTTTRAHGRRCFPADTLQAIRQAIGAGEDRHAAEVRMIVEAALPLGAVLDGQSARGRAHELFSLYRIWDTDNNSGILVYVNLADRKVEIVADRGVGAAMSAADWQRVCRVMTEGFARGEFHAASTAGLALLNDLLEEHFPDDGGSRNQLSDRPMVL